MGLCLSSLPTHHDVTTVKVSITTHTTHTSHTVVALFSEEGTKWYEIVYPVKVSKSSRVLAKKEGRGSKILLTSINYVNVWYSRSRRTELSN